MKEVKFLSRLDRYIMSKFIGTYIYSIVLIISIAIVFDVNENLSKFATYGAPLKAIVFDYYANFVLHIEISRQQRDYRHAGSRRELQAAHEALYALSGFDCCC